MGNNGLSLQLFVRKEMKTSNYSILHEGETRLITTFSKYFLKEIKSNQTKSEIIHLRLQVILCLIAINLNCVYFSINSHLPTNQSFILYSVNSIGQTDYSRDGLSINGHFQLVMQTLKSNFADDVLMPYSVSMMHLLHQEHD